MTHNLVKNNILATIIINNIIFITLCNLFSISYANDDNTRLYQMYESAQKYLNKANYDLAINKLQKLNNEYPVGIFGEQIQIDLIFAYYSSKNLLTAKKIADIFIKLHHNHPNIDYVLYMRGIINMALDYNISYKLLHLDYSNKNPIYAKLAFYDLHKLITKYPNSKYYMDSKNRLIFLKNRIANYELSIIKFYYKKTAYIPVINRSYELINYFPDTFAAYQTMYYIYKAYKNLNLNYQANEIMLIIKINKKLLINQNT